MTSNRNALKPVVCRCGKVLSADGVRWISWGYRVSRRNVDGSPMRGTVSHPDTKGVKPLCRACADEAVAARWAADTALAKATIAAHPRTAR